MKFNNNIGSILSEVGKFPPLIKTILSKNPNYIILFVTSKCNAKCGICCNWQRIENPNKDTELSIKEYIKIAKNFHNLEYLTISGGEPFLRDDLWKIITIFIQISKVRVVTIPTNGTLTKSIIEQIGKLVLLHPNVLFNVNLSIDAIDEDHDKQRGLTGCFNQLMKSFQGLKLLQKKNSNLVIQTTTVLSKFNQDLIGQTLEWLRKRGIENSIIALVRGKPRILDALNINPIIYIRTINSLSTEFLKFDNRNIKILNILLRSLKIYTWKVIANIYVRKERLIKCTAGKKMLVISETGIVYPCEILEDSFGNLRDVDYNLKSLISLSSTKEILRDINEKKCNCTFECAIQNSLVNNPFHYYNIFRYSVEIFNHILKKRGNILGL